MNRKPTAAGRRIVSSGIQRFRYLETSDTLKFGDFTGQGLALPPAVLRKIYWDNPKRLIPGL